MSEHSALKTGVLFINLGTPEAPTTSAVRRYLTEFLSDPRVVDLPAVLRYLLLYGFILPFRSRGSARLYQKIWTPQGSPLLLYSQALRAAVEEQLGPKFSVALGMRCGKPSIASALRELYEQSCRRLIIFPLFPQSASAMTGSAIESAQAILKRQNYSCSLQIQFDFFDEPGYINSLYCVIQENVSAIIPEHFIFSYHGLPYRHLKQAACSSVWCARHVDCPIHADFNEKCYRAQCFKTSALLAGRLSLSRADYSISFQSRLGRAAWIQPYTDQQLMVLARRGIKKIAIVCPSFVADCLETLEEIGLRAQAQWQRLGGESLQLVPALNAHPVWVKAVCDRIIALEDSCLPSC